MQKVGLALAGGGVKGSYQIGAYLAFKKCHIKFNGIVGTSIGAANAAVLVAGNYRELLKMWQTINPGELLNIDPALIRLANGGNVHAQTILGLVHTSKRIIKEHGLDLTNIKKLMNNLIDEKKVRQSKLDFGLATYNFTKKAPLYLYKEDIPQGMLVNYCMASCSLPIFKLDSIDDDLFLDGGFYDNCPSNMLIKKHYDLIYEVKINGIGLSQDREPSSTKIITISPSRDNGSILEMNHQKIIDNIYMGYYDTLKKLDKYLGYQYTFNYPLFMNYANLFNKTDKFTYNRIRNFFKVYSDQAMIIKALEYIMSKENYNYNQVYSIRHVIKAVPNKDNFVYAFIRGLSI
jgi:NTE family protein